MNRLTFVAVAVAAALALGACNRAPASSPRSEQAAVSAADVERCSKGGMGAANDPDCKAASDQRFRQFLDGGGTSEHRNR